MAIVREMKALWRVAGRIRAVVDAFFTPPKRLFETVRIGLPRWDPPQEKPPPPPDHAAVARAREVIQMGTVEERRAFDRVITTWRRITRGEPRQPAPSPQPPPPPPPRRPEEEEHETPS